MSVTISKADAVRTGLRKARSANFVRADKYPGYFLLGQRWEDASRAVSFRLYRAIQLRIGTTHGTAEKYMMEGKLQFEGAVEVNVCVSIWEHEQIQLSPWDPSDLGSLEGLVWHVCIERINHTNIAGASIDGLTDRDCQEVAFLIEGPLRELLYKFASTSRVEKLPPSPLPQSQAEEWKRLGKKFSGQLARGELSRSHPFITFARRSLFQLGLGADELSERSELLSAWQRPAPELIAFHAAASGALQSFDPLRIAELPFDRYFAIPAKHAGERSIGVHGEPDVRIDLSGPDREDPYTSSAIAVLGDRRRIEFAIRDIGFGSLSVFGKPTLASGKGWVIVHMIGDPCSTVFPRKRLNEGVTPADVERSLAHLKVILLSPLSILYRHDPHQVFSI
jgi:hypothetical protein